MNNYVEIVVSPEDRPLVLLAHQFEQAADAKLAEECGQPLTQPLEFFDDPSGGKPLIVPFHFFRNRFEAEVVHQRNLLAKCYQEDRQLPLMPILVAEEPRPPAPQMAAVSHFKKRIPYMQGGNTGISSIDLEELILETITLKRCKEDIYVFAGSHYRYLTDNEVKGAILECLRDTLRETNASSQLNNVLALLKAEVQISGEPNDDPHRLAVQNGELDLEQLRLHPATPQNFNTHFLDVAWRGFQNCPVFREFLDFATGNQYVLRQRMLEVIGYLLTPGNQAKRFVLFQGPGNTGKSVLGDLIRSFYEPSAVAAVSAHQLGDRFSASFLDHRSINISMDLPGGVLDQKAVAVLKQITGGDLLSIEGKNREAYADRIRCKMLFGSNHPLILKNRDEAFAKRVLLVPFQFPVPEEQMDHNLIEKLKQERSGILYWALTAYREAVHRNYAFTGEERFGFKPQQIIIQETPQTKVGDFVSTCCILEERAFTSTEALHRAYLQFCTQQRQEAIADRAAFSRMLRVYLEEQIKPHKRRVEGVSMNGYFGIRLKEDCSHE